LLCTWDLNPSCYKRARIIFIGLENVKWLKSNSKPFTDAEKCEDYGNIDSFELSSQGYRLLRDWGEVIVCSHQINLEWLE
jgi:hypothetical protein